MTPTTISLLQRVLSLSDRDRAIFADMLVQSLSGLEPAKVEDAWLAEAVRRAEAIDRGEETTVPWEEVRERLHAQIRDSGA
ncbi:MAG: addiction module protein [Rhodothermales bacterium]|nr:addiction module protein [Rhodothermales bacterium]MBO6780046.1 addiction module protein [Rhodothermales bacterium]